MSAPTHQPLQTFADRARELIQLASAASQTLIASVQELVTMRAWEVLGHATFCDMWHAETDFPAPNMVRVLAVQALASEGMNSSNSGVPNGHRTAEVAAMVGLPINSVTKKNEGRDATTYLGSGTVSTVLKQLDHGVPPEHVIFSASRRYVDPVIDKFGSRKRGQPRRMGKSAHELVTECFLVVRRDSDAVAEIAREAGLPKAEILRQAVAEYLMRHRDSRPAVAE